jgi:hypothetical protein
MTAPINPGPMVMQVPESAMHEACELLGTKPTEAAIAALSAKLKSSKRLRDAIAEELIDEAQRRECWTGIPL